MDNVINEQPLTNTEQECTPQQTSSVEKGSLGKFKDVDALMSAYNSLQAEFTKRCQRIKELESAIVSADKVNPTEIKVETTTQKEQDTTLKSQDDAIKDYLKDLFGRRRSAIVLDSSGLGVRTPVSRPRTVRAAGELAKELLGNNK